MLYSSVTRVTVQHREACRVMPNSYPEWPNFQSVPNNHYGFFFLHTLRSTIAFRLEYVLVLSILCRNNFIFQSRNVWFGSYLRCKRWNDLKKMVNMKSKHAKWRQNDTIDVLASCQESSYTLSWWHFPNPGWVHGNSGRVCKKRFVSTGENRGNPFLAYQIRISEVFAWDRNIFLHTRPGFPWTRPGLGNVVLHEGYKMTLVHDVIMMILTSWRHFDVLTSFPYLFPPNVSTSTYKRGAVPSFSWSKIVVILKQYIFKS